MAEIKIAHKSSNAWIWWLIGLAVIAAIVWWLFARNDRDDRTALAGGETAPVAVASGGAVTAVGALTGTDAASMAGRQVALDGVPVQEVVSDRGFWVGDPAQRVFVVRANQSSANTPPDGAVNAGQSVAVYGTAQRMPADLTQQSTEWNLRSTDLSALGGQPLYVQADSVRILSR